MLDLGRTGIEKVSLTQYIRWGWQKNFFSLKMLGKVGIKNSLTQCVKWDWH